MRSLASGLASDSASDWWGLGVNALIGVATLLALFLSWRTARQSIARERSRDAQALTDLVNSRAARQALRVRVEMKKSTTGRLLPNGEPALPVFAPEVVNASDAPIFDVVVQYMRREGDGFVMGEIAGGMMSSWNFGPVQAMGSEAGKMTTDPDTPPVDRAFEVTFTDAFSDRWKLEATGTLRMLRATQIVGPPV